MCGKTGSLVNKCLSCMRGGMVHGGRHAREQREISQLSFFLFFIVTNVSKKEARKKEG